MQKVKTFFTFFYIQEQIFIFYDVQLFLVKSVFCIKFMALLLLIPLIIQQLSENSMFEIAISLRFIEIIDKSWDPLQTFGGNVKRLSKKYQ